MRAGTEGSRNSGLNSVTLLMTKKPRATPLRNMSGTGGRRLAEGNLSGAAFADYSVGVTIAGETCARQPDPL